MLFLREARTAAILPGVCTGNKSPSGKCSRIRTQKPPRQLAGTDWGVAGLRTVAGLPFLRQQRLAPQQCQRAGSIGDLALAGHAQRLLHRHEVDLHQLGWLPLSLTEFHAGGQIDISDLVGDAVGGVELTYATQIGGSTADFFQEFAAGDFLGRQAGRKAAGRYLVAPVSDGLLYASNQVTFLSPLALCSQGGPRASARAQENVANEQVGRRVMGYEC